MSNKGIEILSEIGEDLTLGDDDVKKIMEVRGKVLQCLLSKQSEVGEDTVMWAEFEGIIDCIENMYDPLTYLKEGSNQWH